MKTKLFTAIMISSASILFSNSTSAQGIYGQSIAKNISKEYQLNNYMAANTNRSLETSSIGEPLSKATLNKVEASVSVRSLYMASEQFVFDNLGSLKKAFAVSDIYFDLDQAEIRPDALPALNALVNLMMEHPEISVATTSHSDTRMSKYNEKLNLRRAQAANAYLISKGIGADRLSIEKHGRPAVANPCNNDAACSLAVQQLNRRTEFNIIYNGVNLGQIN